MQNKNSGFTLIELIVTATVTGVIIVSISQLYLMIQTTQRKANYLESATRAAQREVEVLRNNNYNLLTPGEDIDFTADLPDNLPRERSGTVEVSEPVAGLRRVDVTVSYTDSGKTKNVTLSSMIGVIGIGQ
jgi:prepilin-type N-terminal cleavage/methylation domain-containing protein